MFNLFKKKTSLWFKYINTQIKPSNAKEITEAILSDLNPQKIHLQVFAGLCLKLGIYYSLNTVDYEKAIKLLTLADISFEEGSMECDLTKLYIAYCYTRYSKLAISKTYSDKIIDKYRDCDNNNNEFVVKIIAIAYFVRAFCSQTPEDIKLNLINALNYYEKLIKKQELIIDDLHAYIKLVYANHIAIPEKKNTLYAEDNEISFSPDCLFESLEKKYFSKNLTNNNLLIGKFYFMYGEYLYKKEIFKPYKITALRLYNLAVESYIKLERETGMFYKRTDVIIQKIKELNNEKMIKDLEFMSEEKHNNNIELTTPSKSLMFKRKTNYGSLSEEGPKIKNFILSKNII